MHLRRLLVLLLGVIAALVVSSGPAAAHTGFDSSDPADGAVLDGPVDTVTLRFTGDAEPVGSGFEALEAGGAVRSPTEVSSDDGSTWVLRFEPPLAGGPTGVRWAVKAPDAHPIEGSFSFRAGGVAAGPGDVGEGDLESFLVSADGPAAGNRIGAVGRTLSIVGALIGVGALVFAATVLRGSERDVLEVMFWVRRAGLLMMVGAALELVGQAAIETGGSWSSVMSPSALWSALASWTGLAIVLRLAGGSGLLVGARSVTVDSARVPDVIARSGRLVTADERTGPAVTVSPQQQGPDTPSQAGTSRVSVPASGGGHRAWTATRDSMAAVAGAVAVVLSFAFDGHTASKGLWPLHGLTDVVHVTAAAVWVGGVAMVAAVCRGRHQRGAEVHAAQLGLRFSAVATVALVAVAVAGLVLVVTIVDGPGDLISTPWGRLLLVKLALVATAASAGAYNHKVLVPALQDRPHDPTLISRFRRVVTIEAVVLVAVGAVTAWLVGAAA